jgi:hypothetical protein
VFHVLGLKTLAMFCSAAIRLFWLRKDRLALSYLSTKIGNKKTPRCAFALAAPQGELFALGRPGGKKNRLSAV